jgi:hypothetical protein
MMQVHEVLGSLEHAFEMASDKIREQAEQLEAKDKDLLKYGGHTHECKYMNFSEKRYGDMRQCSCGWMVLEQALKRR